MVFYKKEEEEGEKEEKKKKEEGEEERILKKCVPCSVALFNPHLFGTLEPR